ncbi:hypothetical protein M0813_27613 [Anaeramoeba flamelloides]|uniref:Uncharacterized protein n=1 Tax=Anaeramoeba flamelloides TaxID=1746091 RepID=A0AAV7YAM9_9EUKA|nr:hypothetical protein M0812_28092 [Anaeramoeba flamelloides]KAJ6236868.1 hypothetical protein M0813_27613 [Anaeramoeba flamelloides]|eukprot:Anaeramoba_flamelloidesa327007_134.p1 GENE.a327007_134~~a327007_134.p1  ORF type:complete len:354 (-),score=48.60 a327007_134:121-1182(-)
MKYLFTFFFLIFSHQVFTKYVVSVERVNQGDPLFNSQDGKQDFSYNYNPAYVPLYSSGKLVWDALLVRSQESDGSEYGVKPSQITFSASKKQIISLDDIKFEDITNGSVVLKPEGSAESFGVEDPRLAYNKNNKLYYLLYSAVETLSDGAPLSRLSLATSPTPHTASSWIRKGPLFPSLGWSKSGALLIRDEAPHYLFFGDSHSVNGLQLAITDDLKTFQLQDGVWLPMRESNFDSKLVEAGPPPLQLSDGNYLFIYNSAKEHPSTKPNYSSYYQPGFVILDKDDPTKILQRSDTPIMSPKLGWEIGEKPWLGLTPNVVFIEGMKPLGNDKFLIFYGGADSVVGTAEITVKIE